MASQSSELNQHDGLTRGWQLFGVVAAVFFGLGLIIALAVSAILAALIVLAGLIYLGWQGVAFLQAKSRALKESDVTVFHGLAKLIAWNPNEGVLFLKNKNIDYVDDNPNDGGGIRVIFPILGEEIVSRIPLEIQTTNFFDEGVLTKEFVPLSVKASILWKITDLGRFYLSLSKDFHDLRDNGYDVKIISNRDPQLETAHRWVTSIMEETSRAIISRTGTGLLIYDRLADDLPLALPGADAPLRISSPESSAQYNSATEGLARAVQGAVNTAISQFGISVERVTLQQVNMPPEIYAAAVDACTASYAPLRAKAEALSEQMKLSARAGVIGADALGVAEIAANAPALAVQDLLAPLFQQFARRSAARG